MAYDRNNIIISPSVLSLLGYSSQDQLPDSVIDSIIASGKGFTPTEQQQVATQEPSGISDTVIHPLVTAELGYSTQEQVPQDIVNAIASGSHGLISPTVSGTTDPVIHPLVLAELGYSTQEQVPQTIVDAIVNGASGVVSPTATVQPETTTPQTPSYQPMQTNWPEVFASLVSQQSNDWTAPSFLAQGAALNPMAQQVAASAQTSSGQNGTTTVPGLAQPAAQQVSGNTPQLGPYNPQNQMGTWDTQLPSYVINNILDTWNIPVSGRNGAPSSSPASGGGSWFTGNRGRHGWF